MGYVFRRKSKDLLKESIERYKKVIERAKEVKKKE